MRKLLPLLLIVLCASCTKEQITSPNTIKNQSPASSISYNDDNIAVTNFKAQAAGDGITVSFTTSFQKDISKLEILKGIAATNLCSVYSKQITADSYKNTIYQFTDSNEQGSPVLFYMLKYSLKNGNWGYTPVVKLNF